jgi:uncharacterized membrane protein
VPRLLAVALTVGAFLWCVVILAAPYGLTSTNSSVVSAAAVVYSAAGIICHQRATRSFHLGGAQLPVCARCAGLYFSGAVGAMVAWLISGRLTAPIGTRRVLLVAAIPTALSVAIEFLGFASPSNFIRAVCALPLGASAAWIFVRSLRTEAAHAAR